MNERIKALKRQAEDYAGKYSVKHQVFGQALIDALDQKFAELIVLECSSICYKGLENGDEAASLLMNTFGVEE